MTRDEYEIDDEEEDSDDEDWQEKLVCALQVLRKANKRFQKAFEKMRDSRQIHEEQKITQDFEMQGNMQNKCEQMIILKETQIFSVE